MITVIDPTLKDKVYFNPLDSGEDIKEESSESPFRSQHIDKIALALAKAQGSYKEMISNQESPNGPYANLHATFAAVKSGLSENGIAIYQHTIPDDGPKILETILMHSSGQWISSKERIIPGHTLRSTGNKYEIVKRMQAQMILGIAPTDNDPISFDDGGEELAQLQLIDDLKDPDSKKMMLDRDETITTEQYHELMSELDGYPEIAQDVLEAYGIESLADVPKSEYYKTKAKVMRVKRASENLVHKKQR